MEALIKTLINPFFLAALYIVWRFFKGGMCRKHIVVLLTYLYLVSIPFTYKVMYQHWVVDDTVNSKHKYDAVVVLAGIVPSKCYLESDQTYVKNMFICSADFKRAYAGLSFIKNGQANRFVFGDDTSSGAYEVKAVKEFLLDNQVESEQIIITGEVKNTQDEALRVDRLVKNGDINDFILVTSAMHMRRAAAIFEDLGLTPALYSTNKKERNKITIKDFRPHSTSGVYRMLYEFAGYVKFILKK